MLCMCLLVCKLNFTLPAAGCLGPPGTAECQLLIGWLLRKNSRTVCSDLSLYLADHHKQSLSHSLWVTFLAAVSPMWEKVTLLLTYQLMCVWLCRHTLNVAALLGKRDIYVFLPSEKHTKGWNQSSELVESMLGHVFPTLTCKQVNSEIL